MILRCAKESRFCAKRRKDLADDPEILFAAALANHAAADLDGAIAGYRRVAALLPDAAAVYVNLSVALQGQGKFDRAVEACRHAVDLDPGWAAAHAVLGDCLGELGRLDDSVACYRRAAELDAGHVDAHNNLGNVLARQGRIAEAVAAYQRCIVLCPDRAEPYNNLSAALLELDETVAALRAGRQALVLRPDNAEAENNLGNALLELRRSEAAVAAFRRAISLRPGFAEAGTNLSAALIDAGDADAAIATCRQTIATDPGSPGCYNNHGNALRAVGKLDEAAAVLARAVSIAPDDAQAHYNLSAVLLKQGRFEQGWAEYEWRRRTRQALARNEVFDRPEWDGAPLAGKTIVLHGEQGFGDVLQFARFAPLVAAQGGRVVLRVYPPLVRLLRSLPNVAAVISLDADLPGYDCHLPLMSVPHVIGTRQAALPADVPYLRTDPVAVEAWRRRLAALPGRKVGLVWAGDPRPYHRGANLLDRQRSLDLDDFAGLAKIEGLCLISLQKGPPALQAKTPPADLSLLDFTDELADFADTAALMANLDLIISVDTSMAHLAGALAKPVWILSRFDGCWRWLQDRDDSPWYPTARLFRQPAPGAWPAVLRRLADALASGDSSPLG